MLQGLCKTRHMAELQLLISNAVIVTPPLLEISPRLWRQPVQRLREGLWNSKCRNNVQHQALALISVLWGSYNNETTRNPQPLVEQIQQNMRGMPFRMAGFRDRSVHFYFLYHAYDHVSEYLPEK